MSKKFEFTKGKPIITKKSRRLIQNLWESDSAGNTTHPHGSRSPADYTSHLFQSSQEKLPRKHRSSSKKQETGLRKRPEVTVERATVPITPQMIRVALKELHKRRVFISSALIASHLRRCYPIENDPDALKKELNEKLECAVSVGLIVKCGIDKYCIPTLRQEACSNKSAVTAFWNTYYGSNASSTNEELFTIGLPNVRR